VAHHAGGKIAGAVDREIAGIGRHARVTHIRIFGLILGLGAGMLDWLIVKIDYGAQSGEVGTSVPNPKFAWSCRGWVANFGFQGTLATYDSSVALVRKSPQESPRDHGDFRTATLVSPQDCATNEKTSPSCTD
jgi:hypothetical protein